MEGGNFCGWEFSPCDRAPSSFPMVALPPILLELNTASNGLCGEIINILSIKFRGGEGGSIGKLNELSFLRTLNF